MNDDNNKMDTSVSRGAQQLRFVGVGAEHRGRHAPAGKRARKNVINVLRHNDDDLSGMVARLKNVSNVDRPPRARCEYSGYE